MQLFNELPIYRILPPDPDNEQEGMFCVSLVDEPATELNFLQFEKNKKIMSFAVQNKKKHIVTGVSIRCGVPIYRRNKNEEYYVVFEKEDIPLIVEKFMSNNFANIVNIQHDETTLTDKDAVMIESFFIDKERGFCPKEFEDVEDGSWCTSYKILNPDLWELIENGDVTGFSIEICAGLEKIKMEKQNPMTEAEIDQEIIDKLELAKTVVGPTQAAETIEVITPKINVDLNTKTYQSVAYAISHQKIVLLNYTGNSAGGFRQVAISALGTTTAGNEALRIFEFFGSSESGGLPGWRILLYDDVTEFHVTDVDVDIRNLPEYGSGETCSGDPGTFSSVTFEVGDIAV